MALEDKIISHLNLEELLIDPIQSLVKFGGIGFKLYSG